MRAGLLFAALVTSLCAVPALAAGACGGAAGGVHPAHPLPVPPSRPVRERAIVEVGRVILGSLREVRPQRLLFDDVALRALLSDETATRYAALRQGVGLRLAIRREGFESLRGAELGGVCLQGSRLERAGDALGLREDGWVFDRALVLAILPGNRRVASWVEGTFLYTDAGFGALDLARVEEPRWEHSDLELASCDMEVGIRTPLPMVVVTE